MRCQHRSRPSATPSLTSTSSNLSDLQLDTISCRSPPSSGSLSPAPSPTPNRILHSSGDFYCSQSLFSDEPRIAGSYREETSDSPRVCKHESASQLPSPVSTPVPTQVAAHHNIRASIESEFEPFIKQEEDDEDVKMPPLPAEDVSTVTAETVSTPGLNLPTLGLTSPIEELQTVVKRPRGRPRKNNVAAAAVATATASSQTQGPSNTRASARLQANKTTTSAISTEGPTAVSKSLPSSHSEPGKRRGRPPKATINRTTNKNKKNSNTNFKRLTPLHKRLTMPTKRIVAERREKLKQRRENGVGVKGRAPKAEAE